ncbi:LIM domain-containing protein [Aphelenchoides avenae]|nr:LIM domain-containing protein [Aphelenchus avenae]
MNFGSGPRCYKCCLCQEVIPVMAEKYVVEKHPVHKECFKCGICDTPLQPGNCSFDDRLYRNYGPMWFCRTHMMLGAGEKYKLLVEKYGPPRARHIIF